MVKRDFEQQIVKRLDAIISLMLEPKTEDFGVKEKVKILYNLGFDYKQIAAILNKNANNIAVTINSLKKKK